VDEGLYAIDPCEYRCIVQLKSLTWNGTACICQTSQISYERDFERDGMWIFDTQDPNIVIDLLSGQMIHAWDDRDENDLHSCNGSVKDNQSGAARALR
jgi:hypothetical protein